MLVEVHCYNERCSKNHVSNIRHGENIVRDDGLISTLISIRQEKRCYGQAGTRNVYHLVLADGDFGLYKAVVNSGLSGKVEYDMPKVGALMSLFDYQILKRRVSPVAEIPCGVVFVNRLKWVQPPKGEAILKMLQDCVTPATPTVEPDYRTFYVCSDYVDWVHEHCCFSPSSTTSTTLGNKRLSYFVAVTGKQLRRDDDLHDQYCVERGAKRLKAMPGEVIDVHDSTDSDDDSVASAPSCKCVRSFGYAICINFCYPVSKVDTYELFAQVTDRIGEQSLDAATFDDLPMSKKRWCFYWWYAVNMFHLSKGCEKLPDCFLAAVRKKYDDGKPHTGFKSKAQRLEATLE
jgi:hypothetical protein